MKIIKIVLPIALMLGTSLVSMEQDNSDDKKDSFQEELNNYRKQQAAEYAHQKEAQAKEAEYQKRKEAKEQAQREQREQQEQTDKKKADQKKLFAESKKSIEETPSQPEQSQHDTSSTTAKPIKIDESLFAENGNLLQLTKQANVGQYLPQVLKLLSTEPNLLDLGVPNAICRLIKSPANQAINNIIRAFLCNPIIGEMWTPVQMGTPLSASVLSLFFLFLNKQFAFYWYYIVLDQSKNHERSTTLDKYLIDNKITEENIDGPNICSYMIDAAKTTNINLLALILMIVRYHKQLLEIPSITEVQQYYQECSIVTGNETAPDGTTALMFAVGGGYLNLVKQLLSMGADPVLKNIYGDNALSIVTIHLQRRFLTNEQRLIFQQIEQLILSHIYKKRHRLNVIVWLLQKYTKLPNELILKTASEAVNSQEDRLLYLHDPLTRRQQPPQAQSAVIIPRNSTTFLGVLLSIGTAIMKKFN